MRESSSVIMGRLHSDGAQESPRRTRMRELGVVQAGGRDLDLVTRRAAAIMGTSIGAITVHVGEEQRLIAATGIGQLTTP